jgi:hypothetical protein
MPVVDDRKATTGFLLAER